MQYSQLGRTGATVSRLVLGTMNFGPHTSEEDSFAILDRALEQGVTFIDTANVYGGKDHKGRTEEVVGWHLAQANGAAARWAWSPSSRCTTSSPARSSWRCCRRPSTTASG